MRPRSLLLAGLVGVTVLAGCGGDDRRLIPENDAQSRLAAVDDVEQACGENDVEAASRAVAKARERVRELPASVDRKLKRNLRDWVDQVDERLDQDCAEEEEPTPTATATATATETAEPTPTPTPSPTPTATATETPPPEETVVPDATDGTGGAGGAEVPGGDG